MSDPILKMQRQAQAIQDQVERIRKADVAPLYLPWSQRVLNPFPLASSGASWGDMGQPWAANVLAFYASVFVATTNNGSHYWTLNLVDSNASVLASFNTSAASANAATRLSTGSVTQPASSNPSLGIVPIATGSPGAIYIWPAVALLRTGN